MNDLIDSVNELANRSQNPGYQPKRSRSNCSPRDKKSNRRENSWSNLAFSPPRKMKSKQPRFQNRFLDPQKHGRNPDQGLQVLKVFLTTRAGHFLDLQLLFVHGMKPHY